MEKTKPDRVELSEREQYHQKVMVSILSNLRDTPLVLKGGTALSFAYGSNRLSEDLDFDSPKKLSLFGKIKAAIPKGVRIDDILLKKDSKTFSRYVIPYHVIHLDIEDRLKVEVSYRTPVPEEKIYIKDGIKIASIARIIDNKLHAAYDGEETRVKARDLFDLHFLAKYYPEHFSLEDARRLKGFAQDPVSLSCLYQEDMDYHHILNKIMDIDSVVLELYELSNRIYEDSLGQGFA